jgi:hypothetical protein
MPFVPSPVVDRFDVFSCTKFSKIWTSHIFPKAPGKMKQYLRIYCVEVKAVSQARKCNLSCGELELSYSLDFI